MAITYPLTLPSDPGPRSTNWSLQSAVGVAESGYDFKQQVQQFEGQRWVVSATYPTMSAEKAGPMRAFIAKLYGRRGTFLMGDVTRLLPQGSAQYALENAITYSEQFDNAAWTKARLTIAADDTTAPDGTSTADKMTPTAASGTHYILKGTQARTSGITYRCSLWMKYNGYHAAIRFDNAAFPNNSYAVFDLNVGTVTDALNGVTASISDSGNGWYRCTAAATADATTNSSAAVYPLETTTLSGGAPQTVYTGDGTSGIYGWGMLQNTSTSSAVYVKTEASSSPLMSPLVNGASQTGSDLVTDGWATNQDTLFKAGDWVQLGSSGGSQLYMVADDVSSDTSGNATITVVPELRSSPADDDAVTYQSCKGLFRLQRNLTPLFSTSGVDLSRVGFTAVEVL